MLSRFFITFIIRFYPFCAEKRKLCFYENRFKQRTYFYCSFHIQYATGVGYLVRVLARGRFHALSRFLRRSLGTYSDLQRKRPNIAVNSSNLSKAGLVHISAWEIAFYISNRSSSTDLERAGQCIIRSGWKKRELKSNPPFQISCILLFL